MFLSPKKIKYTKGFSGLKLFSNNLNKSKNIKHTFGSIALVANESGRITNFQHEAIRRFLKRFLKKKAAIFFRFFPSVSITKKPNDVRQGRGKGNIVYWSYTVAKGDIILEIRGSNSVFFRNVLFKVKVKLGIKTHVSDLQKRWIL